MYQLDIIVGIARYICLVSTYGYKFGPVQSVVLLQNNCWDFQVPIQYLSCPKEWPCMQCSYFQSSELCMDNTGEKDYYKSLKVAQLRAELSRRDLPIKGNKAELVVRLESYDTAQEHERATTEGAADVDSPMGDAEVGAEGGKGDREMTVEDEGDEVRTHCAHA